MFLKTVDLFCEGGSKSEIAHNQQILNTNMPLNTKPAADNAATRKANKQSGTKKVAKTAPLVSKTIRYVNIEPTTKLIGSTRKAGYDVYGAIADMVDNSLEPRVQAKNVYITVNATKHIVIADDGIGMDEATLQEAMRMGARCHKTKGILGGFGLGMKTAGTSMGTVLTVITRKQGSPVMAATYDTVAIEERNEYMIPLDEASKTQKEQFVRYTKNAPTGTVVIVTSLDQIKNRNTTTLAATLGRRLSEIFRFYLAEKNIFINDEKIQPVDVMMEGLGSVLFYDKTQDIHFMENGIRKTTPVRFKLYILPDISGKSMLEEGYEGVRLNMSNQGVYVMRNNRQIIRADMLNIVGRDPYNNRFRGEMFINGDLDEALGLNFQKNNIASRSESVQEQIKKIVHPEFLAIRHVIDRERGKVNEADEVRQQENRKIEKEINSQSKELGLLDKPKRKANRQAENERIAKEIQKRSPRNNDSLRPLGESVPRAVVEIRNMALGAEGNIVEYTDKGNGSMLMTWNTEHPFYDKFLASVPFEVLSSVTRYFVAQGRQQFKQLLAGDILEGDIAGFEIKVGDYNQQIAKEVALLM